MQLNEHVLQWKEHQKKKTKEHNPLPQQRKVTNSANPPDTAETHAMNCFRYSAPVLQSKKACSLACLYGCNPEERPVTHVLAAINTHTLECWLRQSRSFGKQCEGEKKDYFVVIRSLRQQKTVFEASCCCGSKHLLTTIYGTTHTHKCPPTHIHKPNKLSLQTKAALPCLQ